MPTPAFPGQIAFLGTGKMATALAAGMIRAGFVPAERVIGTDVVPAAREAFTRATGGTATDSFAELLAAPMLVLAVKPQQMEELLRQIAGQVGRETLVVTVAAGLPVRLYEDWLRGSIRVIRVMPNTPCLVGAGASGFCRGKHATDEDAATVRTMLETVGLAVEVSEPLLDAVTGLSGSGPAYGYLMIEALSDGGVRAGLPRDVATKLAAQTLLGAARMVLETGEHPGTLKDAVTSPGGTTIAGLHALEQGGLRGLLMNAVAAATERARELGE